MVGGARTSFALLAVAAWAGASAEALDISRPEGACAPAPGEPDVRVFALPERGAERCDVAPFTFAVRDAGSIEEVYRDQRQGTVRDFEAERIEAVVQGILADARDGDGVRLLIYAHGGMVRHDNAVRDAETLAPYMMRDGYRPLFLVWNADFATAYGDRVCCVRDGVQSEVSRYWFGPARVLGDVVAGIGRTPESWGKQVDRFVNSVLHEHDPHYYLDPGDAYRADAGDDVLNCTAEEIEDGFTREQRRERDGDRPLAGTRDAAGVRVVYPPFCTDDGVNARGLQFSPQRSYYYVTAPIRVVTTTAQGVGASAWDNMVRRTRLPFSAPPDFALSYREHEQLATSWNGAAPSPFSATHCADMTRAGVEEIIGGDSWRDNGPEAEAARREAERRGPQGAFARLFARLQCEFDVDPALASDVSIHFYGHSMGAIVGNELMRAFPRLPYDRVVYMAAASSIRDFARDSEVVFEERDDLEFFSLMLHPVAESREVYANGIPPSGSLLEWIDEMFEGVRSFDDRTFGKWANARQAFHLFPAEARERMVFRVFPLQRDMTAARDLRPEGAPDVECMSRDHEPAPARCHPLGHGEFNRFSFWRDRYLYGHLPASPRPSPEPAPTEVAAAALD